MKRNAQTTFVIAIVAMLFISCGKETEPAAPSASPTRNVGYAMCGESGTATVVGDSAWRTLLNDLFDAVDEGCEVSFWNVDSIADYPRDVVSHRTAVRDSACIWSGQMFDRGHTMSVFLDTSIGNYICSASKVAQTFDASFVMRLYQIVGQEELLIVNSQSQFDSLFPDCCLPLYVDFGTQSLLAAWGTTPASVYSTEASVECNGNDVTVTININLTQYWCAEGWKKVFACDKITDTQNATLNVNMQYVQ